MSAQLVEQPRNELMPILAITPATLLQMAVQQGADLTKLEKLMDLQERWEANQARKAFVEDMAAFKANPPDIFKTNHVKFGNTEYMHATLSNVTDAVCIGLANHNLSHRWQVEQREGRIAVMCIITHVQGHSESVRLESSADSSGGKNSIQAIASAITYLERYTLLAACGLATKDMQDDDGRGAEDARPSSRPGAQAVQRTVPEYSPEREKLIADFNVTADMGAQAFRDAWASLAKEKRALISDKIPDFKTRADAADNKSGEGNATGE